MTTAPPYPPNSIDIWDIGQMLLFGMYYGNVVQWTLTMQCSTLKYIQQFHFYLHISALINTTLCMFRQSSLFSLLTKNTFLG